MCPPPHAGRTSFCFCPGLRTKPRHGEEKVSGLFCNRLLPFCRLRIFNPFYQRLFAAIPKAGGAVSAPCSTDAAPQLCPDISGRFHLAEPPPLPPPSKSFSEAPSIWNPGRGRAAVFSAQRVCTRSRLRRRVFKVPREQPGLARTPLPSRPGRPWGDRDGNGVSGATGPGSGRTRPPGRGGVGTRASSGAAPAAGTGSAVLSRRVVRGGAGDSPPHRGWQTGRPSTT